MSFDLLIALFVFAFVSSVTPGPNNLMLMASGANWGARRTVPHLLGVAIGFVVLTLLIGAGLNRALEAWPPARTALKAVSLVYMLWLAWRLATAAPPGEGKAGGRPLTFLEAAAFQWVNPKAWAMALTALAAYAPSSSLAAVAVVALVFGAVNLPSVALWVLMGLKLRRLLTAPRIRRAFNLTMAALLLVSLWPMLAA